MGGMAVVHGFAAVIFGLLIVALVYMTFFAPPPDDHTPVAEDIAEDYEQIAQECAVVAGDAVKEAGTVLAGVENLDDGALHRAERAMVRVNQTYANAVECLFVSLDTLVPHRQEILKPGGATGGLFFVRPEYYRERQEQLYCPGDRYAPPTVTGRIRQAAALWQDTGLAMDADSTNPVRPFERWEEITGPGRFLEQHNLLPFYSTSQDDEAWLTYHPDDHTFTVHTPTVQHIREYCVIIGSQVEKTEPDGSIRLQQERRR